MATKKRVYFTRNISWYVDLPESTTPSEVAHILQGSIKTVGITKINKDQTFIHKSHLPNAKSSI